MEEKTNRIGISLTKCLALRLHLQYLKITPCRAGPLVESGGKAESATVSVICSNRGSDATSTAGNLSNSRELGREGRI